MPARRSEFLSETEFARITKGVEVENGFGFIYSWKNLDNGKEYVGKWEGNLWALCVRYLREIRSGYVKNRAIINAMRHYGIDGFCLEVLFVSKDRVELFEQEKHFIHLRKSKTVDGGYNCTGGGDGGDTFTWQDEEIKAQRRKNRSGKVAYRWSEEQREFMRNLYTGRPIPQEQRDKISKSLTGKTHSEETRAKQSKVKKESILWNRVVFSQEQIDFIKKHRHKCRRIVAKLFNAKFNTNYSSTPFIPIKRSLKNEYANTQINLFP